MSSFWKRWGPHAERMRRTAIACPVLLRRIADAPDKTFHVYAIRLNALLRAEPGCETGAIAEALTAGELTDLIAAAWGVAPAGALTVLDRCGPDVRDEAFYEALSRCLLDARFNPILRAMPGTVTPRTLTDIEAMSGIHPSLDDLCGRVPAKSLPALHWLLCRLGETGATLDERWLRRKLRAITPQNWKATLYDLTLAHPPVAAPWAGTGRLKPVESVRELRRTARVMKLCLGEMAYALRLIRRLDAFYVWRGEEVAAIQIELLRPGEWQIYEMNGIDNAALKPETVEAIESEFALGGIYGEEQILQRLVYRFMQQD